MEETQAKIQFKGLAGIVMAEALLRGSIFVDFDFYNYCVNYKGPKKLLESFEHLLKSYFIQFEII